MPPCGQRSATLKSLLDVLAATIRGSSRSRVKLRADLEVPVTIRRLRPQDEEYKIFMLRGERPAHDDFVAKNVATMKDAEVRAGFVSSRAVTAR